MTRGVRVIVWLWLRFASPAPSMRRRLSWKVHQTRAFQYVGLQIEAFKYIRLIVLANCRRIATAEERDREWSTLPQFPSKCLLVDQHQREDGVEDGA